MDGGNKAHSSWMAPVNVGSQNEYKGEDGQSISISLLPDWRCSRTCFLAFLLLAFPSVVQQTEPSSCGSQAASSGFQLGFRLRLYASAMANRVPCCLQGIKSWPPCVSTAAALSSHLPPSPRSHLAMTNAFFACPNWFVSVGATGM